MAASKRSLKEAKLVHHGEEEEPFFTNAMIFYFVMAGIGIILFIAFIAKCCCMYAAAKKAAKKSQRMKMRGVFVDELPGGGGGKFTGTVGEVEYLLEYTMDKQELTVDIVSCNSLLPSTPSEQMDCFVKLWLEYVDPSSTPNNIRWKSTKVQKTTTIFGTSDPAFGESFTFKFKSVDLPTSIVKMEFYNYSSIAHDILFGKAEVDISKMDLLCILGKVYEGKQFLDPCPPSYPGIGELCLILVHDPDLEELKLTVLEAAKLCLPGEDEDHYPDVVVHAKLIVGKKVIDNKHTQYRKKTKQPYFSETLIFKIKPGKLPMGTLSCKLKYKTKFGLKTLGQVRLGLNAHENGPRTHWNDMVAKPKQAIAMWHSLKTKAELNSTDSQS